VNSVEFAEGEVDVAAEELLVADFALGGGLGQGRVEVLVDLGGFALETVAL